MKVVNKFNSNFYTTNDKAVLFSTSIASLNLKISNKYEEVGKIVYESKNRKLTKSKEEHLNSLFADIDALTKESNKLSSKLENVAN